MPKKLLYQDVLALVNTVGKSELISTEYVNSATPLQFKCNCGNVFKRTFSKYYSAKQYVCPACAKRHASEMSRLSLEDVKNYISENGCEYVSGEYKNLSSRLKIKCSCGRIFERDFSHFKRGQQCCEQCWHEKLRKSKTKYDTKSASEILAKSGYTLLEEYVDCQKPLKCMCSKGHLFEIKFSYFLVGHSGCKACANENLKGENHYNYKGGESEVIDYFRKHIKTWKQEVAKKYNYQCAITGSRRDCVVHHLVSFNTIMKEAALEAGVPIFRKLKDYTKEQFALLEQAVFSKHTTDIGILLQRKVHNKFHNIYGKGDNTVEQFEEFTEKHYSLIGKEILSRQK